MESNKQIQKAGENSQQVQMVNPVFNIGITEERAREIYKEMTLQAIEPYTQEAYQKFHERVEKLENMVIPYVAKNDTMLAAFADPAFQLLLRQAQETAATTEREDDYAILFELLVCHVQKGDDRKNRAGISQAIKIVNQIDNDALCALTVSHAVQYYLPTSGNCREGLETLNSLFSQLMYQELPHGTAWLDHLDILGAIRLSLIGEMKKFSEYYTSLLNGYACVGIKIGSDDYQQAIDMLNSVQISSNFLIQNECLDGYARLNIRNDSIIDHLFFTINSTSVPLNDSQKNVLKQIFELYSNDSSLHEQVITNFMQLWDSYEALYKLRIWWESIPNAFQITRVGRVLAHTNAKRCSPTIPDLI